jgi:hypothetical protein
MAAMATPGSVVDLPNPFPTMIRPFGTLPGGREFGQVSAIDLDIDGRHLWVADRCGASSCSAAQDLDVVFKFDQEGNVVTSFGAGMFIRPHGVTVDSDGNVWVTDHQNVSGEQAQQFPAAVGKGQQVFKFSPTGEVLLALGTPVSQGIRRSDSTTLLRSRSRRTGTSSYPKGIRARRASAVYRSFRATGPSSNRSGSSVKLRATSAHLTGWPSTRKADCS